MRILAIAVLSASFLFACADNEPQTSTFDSAATTSTPATTTETKSDSLPAQPTVAAPSEPKKEEPAADAGAPAPAVDDEPEWMKNCLPFIPCFPPDEPSSDSADESDSSDDADACPPFDPICQTNAAMKYYGSK